MKGMLLGLGDIIANALGDLIMFILKPIIRIVFDFIIAPLLALCFEIISYAVGAVAYVISSFILQLIDFVEVLFRALAGLDTAKSATGLSVELSLDGDSGDILIQLIRNDEIQQAFIAMCVVGIFLLVVTTVFQIIKTEYTTEGAKNAKGPIFQKAFKGLANLMLLPLLVVFGIVFANQLLGLLDKATSVEGENPTISGLLFVAAASEAHHKVDYVEFEDLDENSDALDIIIAGIIAATDVFLDGLGVDDPEVSISVESKYLWDGQLDEIESNFINQKAGYKYYNIGNVIVYYNYAHINYLLLLFGGVFVLKALFFSCFGMVIRLYKCAMLFIIAPAVIGMTPINEGGVGKWRTSFIGQVLSAYGTILSLNLFFIIVRVLLSIEVNFDASVSGSGIAGATAGYFGSSFMTMLLKAIFVLAGCLLIEKFSKELGGYFGAEDAMSAGKDMAGQVGDLAMKGVKTAAMVGVGGAMLGGKALKATGLADKMKASNAAYKDARASGASRKDARAAAKTAGNKAMDEFKEKKAKEKEQGSKAHFNAAKAKADQLSSDRKASELSLVNHKKTLQADQEKLDDINLQLADEMAKDPANRDASKVKQLQAQQSIYQNKVKADNIHIKRDNENIGKIDGEIAKQYDEMEPYAKKQQQKQVRRMAAVAGVVGLGEEGKKLIPGRKYYDEWNKAQDTGGKTMGDPFEAAVKSKKYMQGKAVQDYYHDAPILGAMVANQNAMGAIVSTTQIVKEAKFMNAKIETNGNDILSNLSQALKNSPVEQHAQLIEAARMRLEGIGSSLEHNQVKSMALQLQNNPSIKFKLSDFKIDFNPDKIQAAVVEAMKSGGNTPEAIQEAIKKVFGEIAAAGNPQLMKMLQDVIAKVMNDIPK